MYNKTILIIDDDEDILSLLNDRFLELSCKVISSTDSIWVLNNVDFSNVDCIITDILMPKMSGTDLVKKIQELGYFPDLYFITGYSDYSREELNKYKPMAVIFKPFDVDEVSLLIQNKLLKN